MLSVWYAAGKDENLYFAVNIAKEVVVENKNFQLLNASMYEEVLLKSKDSARYNVQFFDYAGELVKEWNDVTLEEVVVDQSVMLIKGECLCGK